jgi:hypothetical protein
MAFWADIEVSLDEDSWALVAMFLQRLLDNPSCLLEDEITDLYNLIDDIKQQVYC